MGDWGCWVMLGVEPGEGSGRRGRGASREENCGFRDDALFCSRCNPPKVSVFSSRGLFPARTAPEAPPKDADHPRNRSETNEI